MKLSVTSFSLGFRSCQNIPMKPYYSLTDFLFQGYHEAMIAINAPPPWVTYVADLLCAQMCFD